MLSNGNSRLIHRAKSYNLSMRFAPSARSYWLRIFLVSSILSSCGQPFSVNGSGDGVPIEGVENKIKTYELEVNTVEYLIGISFENDGIRKADVYERASSEQKLSINVGETSNSGKRIFSGNNFDLQVEDFVSGENAPTGALEFSANVSIDSVEVDENYFGKTIPAGLGAKTYTCAGKESLLPFASGSGLPLDPYLICSIAQLNQIRDTYTDKAFRLMANLNFDPNYDAPQGWLPIGDTSYPFRGRFDGGGRTISGLKVNRTTSNNGLFGYAEDPIIKNVKVLNASIQSGTSGGVLLGWGQSGEFSGIEVSGTVIVGGGNDNAGGMIGNLWHVNGHALCYFSIKNSFADVDVTVADDNGGGLVGTIDCSDPGSELVDSGAIGDVTGSMTLSDYLGGLVGHLRGGKIIRSYAKGDVTGHYILGGLAGRLYSTKIYDSFASGNVNAEMEAGGLVGGFYNSGSLIENSYASGTLTVNSYRASGLVSVISQSANLTIRNSFSASVVNLLSGSQRGGLLGFNDASTVTIESSRWYHDGVTTECIGGEALPSGCGIAVSQNSFYDMNTVPLSIWKFDGRDADPIWVEQINTYPLLK